MRKDIDIKALIAEIKAGIEKATGSTITKDKVVSDITGLTVELCNLKKQLSDIINFINLDSATGNKLKLDRITRLDIATTNIQDCIESLVLFCDSNK